MDYKRKDVLIKHNIQKDIRNQCLPNILEWSLVVFVCFCIFALMWYLCDLQKTSSWDNTLFTVIFILYICGFLCIMIYWTYLISSYLKSQKTYSVMIDTFSGICPNKFRLDHSRSASTFLFAVNGRYNIFYNRKYYLWAEYYSMYGSGIIDSSIVGEDFYVVVANKKIVSIYNKKMFELSDEFNN